MKASKAKRKSELLTDDSVDNKPLVSSTRMYYLSVADFTIPVSGFLIFLLLFFKKPEAAPESAWNISHPWDVAANLADSARNSADSSIRKTLFDKSYQILLDSRAKYPYHAKIWTHLSFYYLQNAMWDSCIACGKQALKLGSGTTVNSIEKYTLTYVGNAANEKINAIGYEKDNSLKILEEAEVKGVLNPKLLKLRGMVYNNAGDAAKAKDEIQAYLKFQPTDIEALYAMVVIQYKLANFEQMNLFIQKVQAINPNYDKLLQFRKAFNI